MGVIIIFALLLGIAAKAGLLGIPLAAILVPWFFKYCFVTFDHVVRGFDEPPTLDIQMVNPLNEQRPLGQLAITLPSVAAVVWLMHTHALAAAGCVAIVTALLLPASIATLGLESNVLTAVSPLAWARVIVNLGPLYLLVLAVIAAYSLLLAEMRRLDLWLPLSLAIGMFAILSIFSLLGGALYERRHRLGLETWHSPEQAAERGAQLRLRESEALVTEAYGQVRVGAHAKAWAQLQAWLDAQQHAPEQYRWLCDRVSSWHDTRYANRLTAEYIGRLLNLKRNGEALDAAAKRLRVDPGFRPTTAEATLKIAELAMRGGGTTGVARALVGDFATRFAADKLVPAAERLRRELAE